jgi:preprotein translocase subunit SecD
VADDVAIRRLIKTGMNPLLGATLVVAMVTACGNSSSHAFRFRTYDPLGYVKVEVTEADVVRESAFATRENGGWWSLNFRLTKEGQAKFRRLTRALAMRGARLHRPLRCVTVLNGTLLSRSTVDYRIFPNGYGVEKGMWFPGYRSVVARRLAAQMQEQK